MSTDTQLLRLVHGTRDAMAHALPAHAVPGLAPRRPLRVCMMVTYDLAAPGGGVKKHAFDLAAALRERGDEVTIVGPSSRRIDDPRVHTFGGVVNVSANGSDNYLGLLVSPRAVRRYFRENQFDVIHVHEPLQPSLAYWTVWFTRHIPHVATFHAYMETESRPLRWARKLWSRAVFRWYQRAIAVSPAASSYASAVWTRSLEIIPNGVATTDFKPGVVAPSPTTRLLFVGRLGDPRKGSDTLFEAYRRLIATGHKVSLDVVGELGGAAPPPSLPGLTYHGPVAQDRLVELYARCDVFVAPSTGQESFGIVLLEAMSSGKPLVCSDIDGYRHVAGPGVALARPGDPGSLAEAIESFVTIEPVMRGRLGELNRRHAQRYDWSEIVERVRGEYLAAIAERDRP
jgi:phosphatidylinositol alpha-mannosyltransferase